MSRTKSNKKCSIYGCQRPHYAKTWCVMHYNRNRRNGDPKLSGPGRRKGENHVNAKLNNEQVLEIKDLIKRNWGNSEISKKFGVTDSLISYIRSGKIWSHLGPDVTNYGLNTSDRDARNIVRLLMLGEQQAYLAAIYGVDQSTISQVFKRRVGKSLREWRKEQKATA